MKSVYRMLRIVNRRQEIYDYFHNNGDCQQFFFDAAQKERYAAYYTSMYLVQDTSESLLAHRARGFFIRSACSLPRILGRHASSYHPARLNIGSV